MFETYIVSAPRCCEQSSVLCSEGSVTVVFHFVFLNCSATE
jgi:hypothetical protein